MSERIRLRFKALAKQGRPGLITFLMAGDPNMARFAEILDGLPRAGADLIEIGMPFSDPMADGPAIQAAALRALKSGVKLSDVLDAVRRFRSMDRGTPVILMGYYNPIYRYGGAKFAQDLAAAGGDGVIIVDLPPEEAGELVPALSEAGVALIRLTTPTSGDARLPVVLSDASGFVYHVAIAGITGTRSAETGAVAEAVARVRRHTDLPIAVGFGIRTPEQAAAIASFADAAVVGTALVETVARLGHDPALAETVHRQVTLLADGIASARSERSVEA